MLAVAMLVLGPLSAGSTPFNGQELVGWPAVWGRDEFRLDLEPLPSLEMNYRAWGDPETLDVLRDRMIRDENWEAWLRYEISTEARIPLASTHKKELTTLIGLRRLANEFSQAICGRTTHPQRLFPGGFLKVPALEELKALKKRLNDSLKALDAVVDLVASVAHRIPAFLRETEYVALVHPGEYPLLWGQVGTSQDQSRPASEYLNLTNEYLVPQSTAKWSKNQAKSYMVGALARFNLNHERLHPGAKKAASKLGLAAPCHNPFFITVAQLVECVHSTEDAVRILDELLKTGVKPEAPTPVAPRAGKGTGAVEVPRGILFHSYEYDDEGRICHADCVIPTNQNHANIQYDMAALTPLIKGESAESIELKLSMLVRAYDPCISCSTHCLDLADRGVVWRQVD